MLPKYCTPAATRKIIPTPTNRPIELMKPIALARLPVSYSSGSHSVYIAKLAPARPSRNVMTKNASSAFSR